MEFTFQRRFLEEAKAEVDKVNKRAKKIKCPPLELEVIGESFQVLKTKEGDEREIPYVTVLLSEPKLVIEGYTLIGTVDHLDGGNMIREVPGETIPLEFRNTSPERCDHCGHKRRRLSAVLLKDFNGVIKQVGRNCCKDFIGHSPTAMLKFLEELRGLENLMINAPEYDLDNEGWGSGGPIGYPLLEVLAVASLVIEKEGWKSNHTAREEFSMSTSHFCGYLLSYSANQEKKLFKQRHGTCDPSEENWEEAKKVKEWMLSNEKSESNYLYNLSLIAKGYYCEPKNTGFAVSAVSAYQREIEKSSMAKEPKLDEWFGKVGEKYGRKPKRKSDIVLPKVDLKLVSCRPFEGYGYGGYPQVKYLCLFKDREGRTFKWWTTAEMPDPGDWYSCAFEVKAHEEYKDNKQTLITRAVLHPIEEKEVCNA